MTYKDTYAQHLSEVQTDISRCEKTGHRVVFGYTSDLDIVFRYDSSVFNQLTAEYLTCKEAPQIQPEDSIDSISDLARVVAAYMIAGAGGEIDITDYRVCQYLNEHFEGVPGLGGTCAQGAAALGAMGMPLIAHISDRCEEVCQQMDYPGLQGIRDGKAVPIMEIATKETPVYHMILQYTKGDTLEINGKTYTVPCSNRLIMDYDTIHKDLHVDPDFRSYLETHAEDVISYNISGLNGMIDPALVENRLAELELHYKTIKEKNPACIFYFESAHYLNPQVKHVVYHTMAQYVDILGMNEEELVVHTQECGQDIDKSSFPDVLRGLELVQKKHGVKGIILHTKDYAMYFGDELTGINIEKGLVMGNLMACTRARTGRYGSYEDCQDSLACPLSETGLRFYEELGTMKLTHDVRLVPSRYMEKPKYTIGLGDTFVAGVQMAFVR
jgi:ADP-dependent phosphofructokinase/glucokinase